MTLPTAAEELRCIQHTFETVIKPALTELQQRSAAVTISHLLRHVAVRIEREGELLFEEIEKLRPVLGRVEAYLAALPPGEPSAAGALDGVRRACAEAAASGYRGVDQLAAEVRRLRQGVCDALTFLNAASAARLGSAGAAIHDELRQYLAWEIEQEAKLIRPAFEGFGPRR